MTPPKGSNISIFSSCSIFVLGLADLAHMLTQRTLLFILALDKTRVVHKISFATLQHAFSPHKGDPKKNKSRSLFECSREHVQNAIDLQQGSHFKERLYLRSLEHTRITCVLMVSEDSDWNT